MEVRWMANSDCLICPAHAVHKENETDKQTLYLEVVGLAGQENWEDYSKEIAGEWMAMKINGMAPLPHWAKQWSYLDGIDDYIKEGYGDNLKTFRKQVMKQPERLLFSNARLNKVIFQDSEKKSEKPKIKESKSSVKAPVNDAIVNDSEMIFKDLEKHVETWKTFFMTLGEQVWNVPFKVPKMDIQREWKNTEAILHEINEKYPHLCTEEDLYKNLFT
ncbi:FAD linked oxidase domain-containing [Paramuricea clavata]|uniref:FAD linked oxidase domain-containing n=1 Tax=Paramuricea clavata TaxID=317549 RepID=A0A6S7KDE4_PARCT|nr:FAD linked oxidase domain-containing [Paramuricea clavata]